MKREQQQAQMQMALQLLQMLREGRQQDQKLELARQQMEGELMMGRQQNRINRGLKERELSQAEKQFMASQEALNKKYQFDVEQAGLTSQREQAKMDQAERLAKNEREQAVELARMQQDSLLKQAETKNQGLMNPAVLEYLQTTMQLPPGAERNALLANLEKMTGQTFERPADQFQQLIKNTK